MVLIVWYLDLQLPVQSVPITTKIVSSNPVHDKVYSIKHYVIKCVSDLQRVSVFLRFPPPRKLTTPRYNWNIVESGVKHHKHTPPNSLLVCTLYTCIYLSFLTQQFNKCQYLRLGYVTQSSLFLLGVFCFLHTLWTFSLYQ